MHNILAPMIVGVFAGLLLITGFSALMPDAKVSLYNKAIADCEKSLPRDQHCKLVAVPIEKEPK